MSDGYTKKEVEEAIVKALEPLSAQGGGYIRSVRPFRGELSPSGILQDALQLPAVFVAYASSTYRPGPCLYIYETMGFNVVSVCRAGGSQDAYRMLADIRDALCGGTLGLDIKPVQLLRESALISTKEVAAFASLFSLTQKAKLPSQGQNT